ncbi:MAG: class I SAM-dependent methyltransferase [Candidatus Stygibacter australis]|nr:class I SAM-dependent methyltransferase [Candidatus Stygibacter australis]MDP8322184.1 class I SAM-dependent methyltransferase [Candidatus Stygibacter australis]
MPPLSYHDICDWETRFILGDRIIEIKFWKTIAENYQGDILELGAGTGCFTIPLIKSGLNVCAVDNSAPALQKLKSKAAAITDGGELIVLEADMRYLDLDKKFSICLATYSTFQYLLNSEDQYKCLKTINDHLPLGGTLCLDLDNDILHPPQNLPLTKLYSSYNTPLKVDIIMSTFWNTDNSQNIRHWHDHYQVRYNDGSITDFTSNISLKKVSLKEITDLLTKSGFYILNTFGDYDFSDFLNESHRLIVVAQKIPN